MKNGLLTDDTSSAVEKHALQAIEMVDDATENCSLQSTFRVYQEVCILRKHTKFLHSTLLVQTLSFRWNEVVNMGCFSIAD
jgi:hypothetical protein